MTKREDPRTVAARIKFKEETLKLYPNKEYEFLEEFKKSTVPIMSRHNTCGHTWLISPVNFYHGRRCPVCRGGGGIHGSSQDIFEKRVAARVGSDYTVVGKYAGTHTPIGIKHNVCGRITNVSPTNFLKKTAATRCVHCQREEKISQGERAIQEWLDENGIQYTYQWRATELNEIMGNHRFTFDFMVPYEDGSFCLIEYQGELHYRPWRGQSASANAKLENTQKNDRLKADYCAEKGIPLLVVPYTDLYRIKDILNRFFF